MERKNRQEAIDELLLPYRKMSMTVKVAKWELEKAVALAAHSTESTKNGARSVSRP